jgi:ribosomal protein S18 acetylase RimI-like enzyme
MEKVHIEKITPALAESVHDLLALCGRDLAARQGFRNWDPPAPLAVIRRDALEREVFLFSLEDRKIATVTLGLTAPVPYGKEMRWSADTPVAVYVNRLALHPDLQGLGYGRFCMGFAEARAEGLGAGAVRCDVLAANSGLRGFYQGLGYRTVGEREHSGWLFACYEKVL